MIDLALVDAWIRLCLCLCLWLCGRCHPADPPPIAREIRVIVGELDGLERANDWIEDVEKRLRQRTWCGRS